MNFSIIKNNVAKTITAIALFCFLNPIMAQEDTIGKLTGIIINGPALYRTPEAVDYYSRHGVPATSMESQRDAAIQSLRACIKLGVIGLGAKDAVPVLIDVFPQLEHVVAKLNATYSNANGSMEDWIQTFLVSEKNNFVFSSPFVEFETMSKCENWIEATPVTNIISQKTGRGGKIIEATADVFIIIHVNAGACALGRITGQTFGSNREAWQQWWYNASRQNNAQAVAATHVQQQKKPLPEINAGLKYKLHLVTGDDLSGTVISKNDSSVVFKTDAGSQYSFALILIDKYTSAGQTDSAAVKPVPARQEAVPEKTSAPVKK